MRRLLAGSDLTHSDVQETSLRGQGRQGSDPQELRLRDQLRSRYLQLSLLIILGVLQEDARPEPGRAPHCPLGPVPPLPRRREHQGLFRVASGEYLPDGHLHYYMNDILRACFPQ